jgi:hypothetical protein
LGPARDDRAELRQRHVEPFGDILADPDRLAIAAAAGESLRFNNNLQAFQMRGKRLARPVRSGAGRLWA